jgi:sortase A
MESSSEHPVEAVKPQDRGTHAAPSRLRRRIARAGLILASLGVIVIAYAAVVLFFGDPITGLYESWQQHELAGQLDKSFKDFKPPIALTVKPHHTRPSQAAIRAAALKFERQARPDQPLGRIIIRRIHVNQIFLNGTSTSDLTMGPGRYSNTSFPGLHKVTAIAGHRTTFGAPFRHIDSLERGNLIVLELPYGTFTYRIYRYAVVPATDVGVVDWHHFRRDTLILSACHPLYSASHRWVVFAGLVLVNAPARAK